MPLLDLTEVFLDPLLANVSEAQLLRSVATVTATGRGTVTPGTPVPLRASVQPAPGKSRRSSPDASRVEQVIEVYTTTQLYAVTQGYAADVVLFRGQSYLVTDVENYDGWGQGYCVARCELMTFVENPQTPGQELDRDFILDQSEAL